MIVQTDDFTLRDLYRSLDQRKRPEDVARMILAVARPPPEVARALQAVARHADRPSSMSDDFHRGFASIDPQVAVATILFAVAGPADTADADAVHQYLTEIEAKIGKAVGRNDYRYDRLNRPLREAAGIDLSRRQYNKRFRLAAKMEDKADRRARAVARRGLTLASKSRLASKLTWEQFAADEPTACFIAYYVARCNVRSLFTVASQDRPYDGACEAMMRGLRAWAAQTNWFAVAHVLPDEAVVGRLDDRQRGQLLGRYYEMLVEAGGVLAEVWRSSSIDAATMIVRRGNDSSTWNLMAGAWNKLRDGWFALCHAMGMADVIDRQCFGKVMRLMAADVAAWHRSLKGADAALHGDTAVWAELPLPWQVLGGEAACTRQQVEQACGRHGVDPYAKGWLARRGPKAVATFTPTPELVHGVVVASPTMARAMRKAGVFSGQGVRLAGLNVDEVLTATVAAGRITTAGRRPKVWPSSRPRSDGLRRSSLVERPARIREDAGSTPACGCARRSSSVERPALGPGGRRFDPGLRD